MECRHRRYSVDVHEQTGRCFDCGAAGRMRFVVPMSDRQIDELKDNDTFLGSCKEIVRAIEAVHGIK